MSRTHRLGTGLALILAIGTWAPAVQADAVRDVAVGLGYAGFNIEGQNNHLSGGIDFRVSRDFVGNVLDFGVWDLAFQGPISFEVSTGGRLVQQVDVNLSTALTSRSTVDPLYYELNYEIGGQSVQIPGTLLIDAGFSINRLGFYDMELTLSSRQEVSSQGTNADGSGTRDFDIGPTKVSGNIYADVLALVTQPIFDRTGQPNPFATFSGDGSISDWLTDPAEAALKSLAFGGDLVAQGQSDLLATTPAGSLSATTGGLDQTFSSVAAYGTSGGLVPEPTVMLLMLLGLPAVVRRRARRRK